MKLEEQMESNTEMDDTSEMVDLLLRKAKEDEVKRKEFLEECGFEW